MDGEIQANWGTMKLGKRESRRGWRGEREREERKTGGKQTLHPRKKSCNADRKVSLVYFRSRQAGKTGPNPKALRRSAHQRNYHDLMLHILLDVHVFLYPPVKPNHHFITLIFLLHRAFSNVPAIA